MNNAKRETINDEPVGTPLAFSVQPLAFWSDRIAERIRRRGALFGGCRVCGLDHLTTSCPAVAQERRRQEQEERP